MNNNNSIVSQQALGDCNNRLSILLSRRQQKYESGQRMRETIVQQQVEFRKKLKDAENLWNSTNDKLRKDYANQCSDLQRLNEQLQEQRNKCREMRELLRKSEISSSANASMVDSYLKEINSLKQRYQILCEENAETKYKYDSYSRDRQSMEEELQAIKVDMAKKDQNMAKMGEDFRQRQTYFTRSLNNRSTEIEECKRTIQEYEQKYNDSRLDFQQEFDEKLRKIIEKREKQFADEKQELMRIFKLESKRKFQDVKTSNAELKRSNTTLMGDITVAHDRVSKLRQNKSDLENAVRIAEEEVERLTQQMVQLRNHFAQELKLKSEQIFELNDKFVAKEVQYQELVQFKSNLDCEISSFQEILDKAEYAAGYHSPLADKYSGTGFHNPRKRRRLNMETAGETPRSRFMNAMTGLASFITRAPSVDVNNNSNGDSDFNGGVGGSMCKLDEDNDVKEESCDGVSKVDCSAMDDGKNGNIVAEEGFANAPLSLIGLNTEENMIQMRNETGDELNLKGFVLTNGDRSCEFALPVERVLEAGEMIHVFVGMDVMLNVLHRKYLQDAGIVSSKCLYWIQDVWVDGIDTNEDILRLYDPNGNKISKVVYNVGQIECN